MNYYEELGVSGLASIEEIRQAYKTLARLLHPDHQSDSTLRKLADVQMIRLNEILAVLSDPVQRQRYDTSLRAAPLPQVDDVRSSRWTQIRSVLFQRPRAATILWGAGLIAAASGFAFVLLYFMHDSSVPEYRSGDQTTPAAQAPTPAHKVNSRSQPTSHSPITALPARATPSNSDSIEPAPPRPPREIDPVRTLPPAKIETPTLPPSPPTEPAASIKPVERLPNPLLGTWLYARPATADHSNPNLQYAPEYIELVIKPETSGRVIGRYRGKFHVPDKPISAEVTFQFEGPGEGANTFVWQSGDGAKGQVRMKIVTDGVMEVSWYTTQFGTVQKLASGTAVLYRN